MTTVQQPICPMCGGLGQVVLNDGTARLCVCQTGAQFLDRLLTPDEFCAWAGVSRDWFSARVDRLPGVIRHSRQNIRIHPRTYLEVTTQRKDTK